MSVELIAVLVTSFIEVCGLVLVAREVREVTHIERAIMLFLRRDLGEIKDELKATG